MRGRLADPWSRAIIVWTVVAVVVAVVLALVVIMGMLQAAGACYSQTGPRSAAGDADFVLMQVAIIWIPLVWLVGLVIAVAAREIRHR